MDDNDDRARQLRDLVAKIDVALQANRAAIARERHRRENPDA
jgi:hypothetical protein